MNDEVLHEEDSEYIKYKKMMSTVFYEIKNIEQRFNEMVVDFKDSQRAHAAGVQNVYDKFVELEKRQKDIEDLLKSGHIKTMIDAIPNEDTILKMFDMIETHPIASIKEKIDSIRDDLDELTDKFTL